MKCTDRLGTIHLPCKLNHMEPRHMPVDTSSHMQLGAFMIKPLTITVKKTPLNVHQQRSPQYDQRYCQRNISP
jgi:hypothetical protein